MFNIYTVDLEDSRMFNVGLVKDKTEEWVQSEVERLNMTTEEFSYEYEEV